MVFGFQGHSEFVLGNSKDLRPCPDGISGLWPYASALVVCQAPRWLKHSCLEWQGLRARTSELTPPGSTPLSPPSISPFGSPKTQTVSRRAYSATSGKPTAEQEKCQAGMGREAGCLPSVLRCLCFCCHSWKQVFDFLKSESKSKNLLLFTTIG